MKKIKKRWEGRFLTILPFLIVSFFYLCFYLPPTLREYRLLNIEVNTLDHYLENQPEELNQTNNNITKTNQEILKNETELSQIQEQIAQLNQSFKTSNPMETVVELSKLLKKNNILLIESSFIDSNISSQSSQKTLAETKQTLLLKKPNALYIYEKQFKSTSEKEAGLLLKLEFIANFENVYSLMLELSQLQIRVFPVSLLMERSNEDIFHHWQMVLWI